MLKVVILGENGSVHIQKWVKAISEFEEIELHVISFDRGVKFDKVTYHPLKIYFNNKLDFFLNTITVRKYLSLINPDLIHAHYATSYGYLGARANFHPFVITGWGADIFDSPKNVLMKQLLISSFKKADAVTVLSKITKTEISKLTNKNVTLIPFGVDIEKFKKRDLAKDNFIRIGTVRTLSEKYGVEFLIRAFSIVCKRHDNIKLEIVGDGPLRSFLESLAKELGVFDKVTFHGYVNQNADFEKYINLMSSFDVFAILSILDSETFGVAAVEASSCSLPIIATDVGGLPEVVQNNETGFLVPPKDFIATANALEKLILDESLRIKMGLQGRLKVENEYFWKNNVNKMVNLYKDISGYNNI
jgi:glycosyltransferase involved in cell wall biosynthesis